MRDLAHSKLMVLLTACTMVIALAVPLAVTTLFPYAALAVQPTRTSSSNNHPVCREIGKRIWASSGLQMWCFGPQPNGPSNASTATTTSSFSSNVDAANPQEDRTPSGVQFYGQSEVSIAATGNYVVEAWNDATAFFSPCPSPMHKEEGTGYGFSANGGKSFTDEGGLPNANCNADILAGDPSVEAWHPGGTAYFYVSSLYFPVSSGPGIDPRTFVALSACKATGTDSSAKISCGQPIIAAASTQCMTMNGSTFCSGLDKEFLSIDPKRGRLYVSYTEFGVQPPPDNLAFGQIELAVCDIGTSSGGIGPVGGTAGKPVCFPGGHGSATHLSPPYFVVAPAPMCVNEGAYPAVDPATGDVYVAYEFNIISGLFPPCNALPMRNVVNYVPFSCLKLTPTSSCRGPAATNSVKIISMVAANIPGYNRLPPVGPPDFPHIAVSDKSGTISIVWNDARQHPMGDILLESFNLVSLSKVQNSPVRVNSDASGGLHFLPALRQADEHGNLNISYYQRNSPNTAITDVYASPGINPRTTTSPSSSTLVTTTPTNWLNVSSDIIPNFGDYTDNYLVQSATSSNTTLYVAWSDGRMGIPQPFEAHTQTT